MAKVGASTEKVSEGSRAAFTDHHLIELRSTRFEPGYWRGIRQPAVLFWLRFTRMEVSSGAIHGFDDIMNEIALPSAADAVTYPIDAAVSKHPILSRVLNLTMGVLDKMGMPLMGGGTADMSVPQSSQDWVVGLPAIAQEIRAPQAAFRLACSLMNTLAAGKIVRSEAVAAEINKLVKQFRPLAPGGINTMRFLQAAHELGIPWRYVANNVYQFGWGSRSRWLDSSLTQEAPSMSVALARNKAATVSLLRQAGLPVPRHQAVDSEESAVKAASEFGYPVVVKAANLDGGRGVYVGLKSESHVREAYADVLKLTRQILLEEYIEGNDYRLQVYKNEVFLN